MKFREQPREEIGIELTPLIDVVFMLLLFFVVSSTLSKKESKLDVTLPKADAQAYAQDPATLSVGVGAKGEYYVNGIALRTTDPQKLKLALASKLEANQAVPVVLAGDQAAPHQAVVSAMEVASALGVSQIQIIAEQPRRL